METNNTTNTNPQQEKTFEYTQMNMFDNLDSSENSKHSEKENLNNSDSYENRDTEIEKDNYSQPDIKRNKTYKENLEEKAPEKLQETLSKINDRNDAIKVLENQGFDYSVFQDEYLQTGSLSQESRNQLLSIGITDEILDNYIKGQTARIDAELNEISKCVGGRETFNSIIKWAGENLDENEKLSLNTIRDENVMKIVLKDLKSRMEEQEGKMPEYTTGASGKVTSNIFRSQAEMFEAIGNPKYKKDSAYRGDIQRKIAASMRAGINLGI